MEIILIVMMFLLGAAIGSFLNVVIYRIPGGESIVFPYSRCQSCRTPLKWYHNIPILSWIFLGGKCGYCKEPISKQYPFVELITGLIFVVLFLKLGLVWYLPFVFASFAALFALVMIDFKYFAVPDSVNFFALAMALIQPDFQYAIIYASAAAAGLYFVGLISSLIACRQAMGLADVIIAGTMGALLGFPNFFVALFLSAILAIIPSIYATIKANQEKSITHGEYIQQEKKPFLFCLKQLFKREDDQDIKPKEVTLGGIPFVPFLALATFIVYLFDSQAVALLNWIMYG